MPLTEPGVHLSLCTGLSTGVDAKSGGRCHIISMFTARKCGGGRDPIGVLLSSPGDRSRSRRSPFRREPGECLRVPEGNVVHTVDGAWNWEGKGSDERRDPRAGRCGRLTKRQGRALFRGALAPTFENRAMKKLEPVVTLG